MSTAGSGRTGHYRAIKMWEAAVNEAGTVERDAVIRALGSARDRAVRMKGFPASIVCEDERVHRTGTEWSIPGGEEPETDRTDNRVLTKEFQLRNVG